MLDIRQLLQFASAESSGGGIIDKLGIDFKVLLIQIGAFLIFFAVIAKVVYPALLAILDKRDKQIEESIKASVEAEKNAAAAEKRTEELMKAARKQADEMLASARAESTGLIDAAQKKAQDISDKMIKDAKTEIAADVEEAKKSLRKETIDLVVLATEKTVGQVVDKTVDKRVVSGVVEEITATK